MGKILLKELAMANQKDYKDDIVLAKINGKLSELSKTVDEDSQVEFVTTAHPDGALTYKRSATLILLKAVYDIVPRENINKFKVEFSLSKGYYCTLKGKEKITDELIDKISCRMKEIVSQDLPINKYSIGTDAAVDMFAKYGMYDKEELFSYRRSSYVNIYDLDGFKDYFYGYMVPSTGYIKYFELYRYDDGLVIQFPRTSEPKVVPEFAPQHKLFKVLKESSEWCEMLQVETVGDLNRVISEGKLNELILVQEALQEKKLAEIAGMIAADRSKKFVMIAGPSSSGKTTTSLRLSIQLKAHGLIPHQISLDNYFVNR
jgi:uridine kinase